MGVPKFFRYISERYPCLSEVAREYQLPDFDNLYLDMNGIIHVCSHPNDADPHFRITEEKIFRDIFHYIESLFRMIQPRKLFFMAVDGVAPRAKMNQQRGRRFRSAKDAEQAEVKARLRGESLPTEDRFDSNCITPGTEFMTRLQAQLKYFVTFKISTDKLWQRCKIILSGHETPGEGEHKIMDYIRFMKSRPEYDPNTRHCLYGLDADLIMLGLCTHEPHFSLLREEVKYGKKNNQVRIPTPEETTFFLLHLSLMREYLDLEFQQLKATLPFPYDVEHIVDDWVLMGFLVGNDFIPHLPELHINKGAFPILYKTYIEVLPTLGGYINEGGSLRLDRFQKYMEKLGEFDIEQFKEHNADLKYFESKTGRKPGGKERHSYKHSEELNLTTKNKDLAALIASTQELLEEDDDDNYTDIDSDEEDDEDNTSLAEFSAHKNNYYIEKLEYDEVTPEVLRSQREGYVRAIQWNLNYYYNGCCSWSWFYPHHYAPYISDIKNFSDLKLEYDLGKPFLPFQQLLAVLPAASKKLLPSAYHDLMVDDTSPIIQFYPTDFKTDLNGKRQEWEAVVLIPFIEQESLIQAMNTKENELTEEEKSRNKHGPMFVYTYTPDNMGSYVSPAYFPALANHHAREEAVHREQLYVEPSQLIKGLCPGVQLDVYFPGFPTLKHIPFTAELQKFKVKVFESASQGENMMLTILPQGHPDVGEVANQLLGKSIFVNWPHLYEARTVVVSNKGKRFVWNPEENKIISEEMNKSQEAQWTLSKQGIEQRYKYRMGIEVGDIDILVYACTLEDSKFVVVDDKVQVEKQWGKVPIPYALQTTRTEIAVYEPIQDHGLTLEQLYPVDATVFAVDPIYYGFMGKVVGIQSPRVKVNFVMESDPDLEQMKNKIKKISPYYMSGQTLANRLGISSHLLSRITGTIYILNKELNDPEEKTFKLNIALNLKFNKRNEEVCGYTKRDRHSNYWMYSSKAEEEVAAYMSFFPDVFTLLSQNTGAEDVQGKDLFPEDTEQNLAELSNWLKELDSAKAERQRCGAQVVEEEVVMAIEKFIDNFNKNVIETTLPCRTSILYSPKPKLGQAADPNTVHRLFDRVVNVRESHTVPLGAKGTIIGLHDMDKGPEAMIDVVFDKEFTGGLKLRCSPHRGYRLPGQALINLTYGINRVSNRLPGKPTAIVEPSGTKEEVSNWNNDGHNSAFASWRNKPNQDFEDVPVRYNLTTPEKARSHFFYKGLYSSPPQPQPQNNSRHPPAHANNFHHSAPQQLSNEYLAMVKQLQKSSQNPKSHVNSGGPGQLQLDPSSELKKMLKIADDTSKKPAADNQFTVKSSPNLSNSYCIQLLSLHQTKGRVPKYLYSETKEDAIVCTVICYNGLEFQGAPAFSNDSAAENAAREALHYLAKEDHRGFGGPGHAPPLFNRPPLLPQPPYNPPNRFPSGTNQNWRNEPAKPFSLPQPPTKWYQNPGVHTFQPEWISGGGGGTGAANPFYQSGPQYQQIYPMQHGQYSSHNQWRPPFIPLQAETRVRQQPQPHSRDKERESAKQAYPTEQAPIRMPPSGAINSARNSARPPRSRIAANFAKPFNFKPSHSDNSQ